MSSQKFGNFLSPQFKQRITLFFLWGILFVALFLVRSVILPFLLAILLAYVFHPVVKVLQQIKMRGHPMPKIASVLLVYLFFAGLIFLTCAFFIPQLYLEVVRLAKEATIFINSLDEHTIQQFGEKIESFFRDYELPLEIVAPSSEAQRLPAPSHKANWISIDLIHISRNLLNDIIIYIKSETKNIISSAQHFFSKVISSLFMFFLILMITGFLLVDIDRIKKFAFSMIPMTDRKSFDTLLTRLDQRLSGVVRGQLTICLINALLTLIGLLIFNIKFAIILATIAGIFSIVPVFGSIISTIPIVLVALTQSMVTALFVLIWVVGIHMLEANFLNPKIMGDSAKIHPVLIILALLVGEHFYGIIGALLSVPIMSVIITIFISILGKARLMDEGVANPAEADTISMKEV